VESWSRANNLTPGKQFNPRQTIDLPLMLA